MGYRGVQWPASAPGLRPRDLDGSARRGVRELLRRLELALSGVDAWIPPGHFLDRERVDRAVAATEEAVRFAAECAGSGPWRPVVSLLLPPVDAGQPAESGLAGVAAALAEIGSRHGVVVADHPIDRPAASALGWGIDPAALLGAGRDPSAAVAAAGASLATARLVDLLRSGLRGPIGEPGEARLDALAYRIALEISGFGGPPIVDARQWRDPLAGLEASLVRWAGDPRPNAVSSSISRE